MATCRPATRSQPCEPNQAGEGRPAETGRDRNATGRVSHVAAAGGGSGRSASSRCVTAPPFYEARQVQAVDVVRLLSLCESDRDEGLSRRPARCEVTTV